MSGESSAIRRASWLTLVDLDAGISSGALCLGLDNLRFNANNAFYANQGGYLIELSRANQQLFPSKSYNLGNPDSLFLFDDESSIYSVFEGDLYVFDKVGDDSSQAVVYPLTDSRSEQIQFRFYNQNAGLFYTDQAAQADVALNRYQLYSIDTNDLADTPTRYPFFISSEAVNVLHLKDNYLLSINGSESAQGNAASIDLLDLDSEEGLVLRSSIPVEPMSNWQLVSAYPDEMYMLSGTDSVGDSIVVVPVRYHFVENFDGLSHMRVTFYIYRVSWSSGAPEVSLSNFSLDYDDFLRIDPERGLFMLGNSLFILSELEFRAAGAILAPT